MAEFFIRQKSFVKNNIILKKKTHFLLVTITLENLRFKWMVQDTNFKWSLTSIISYYYFEKDSFITYENIY